MVIISGRSSLADAKSNDNLLPGDAFHIHNTITNTITVMKVIHHHLHHIVGDALHLHEPRCLQLCLWMVLWIPFAGLFGISSSATLSSYSSNCFNYIDAKSFFRTGQTWGRVGYTESGKRVRVLPLYNYRFPSERNFLQGPWIGFKTPEKAVGSYGWVGVIITRIRRRIIGCLLIDLLLSLLYFV